MAATNYNVEYLGALSLLKGQTYDTNGLFIVYPSATHFIMKTHDALVSINGSDMFSVSYDDVSKVSAGNKFTFNKDCVIGVLQVVGTELPVVGTEW